MNSVVTFQADAIEQTAEIVGLWILTTAADRVDWTPPGGGTGSAGRSVLDQAGEMVRTNRTMYAGLTGSPLPPPLEDEPKWMPLTREEAHEALISSAGNIASFLRNADDSLLTREIDMGGWSWKGSTLISMIENHMMYHGGQICYVQTLYGDTHFRFPGMSQD